MTTGIIIFSFIFFTLAIFTINSALKSETYTTHRLAYYVLKPLTMLVIIGLAAWGWKLRAVSSYHDTYFWWFMEALFICLIGDIFLMVVSKKYFAHGVVCFLLAHVSFLISFFLIPGPKAFNTIGTLFFIILAFLAYSYLYQRLNDLKYLVVTYIVTITLMGIVAVSLSPTTRLIPIGAALFILSDVAVAIRQFKVKFRYGQLVILPTYFMAQYLMTLGALSALDIPY